MRTYVRKLQNKPEHIRQQILWGVVGISMAFVLFLWIYSLSHRFKQNDQSVAVEEEAKKPFKLLSESISKAYQNISANASNALTNKEDKKEEVIIPPTEEPKEKQIDVLIIDKQN